MLDFTYARPFLTCSSIFSQHKDILCNFFIIDKPDSIQSAVLCLLITYLFHNCNSQQTIRKTSIALCTCKSEMLLRNRLINITYSWHTGSKNHQETMLALIEILNQFQHLIVFLYLFYRSVIQIIITVLAPSIPECEKKYSDIDAKRNCCEQKPYPTLDSSTQMLSKTHYKCNTCFKDN